MEVLDKDRYFYVRPPYALVRNKSTGELQKKCFREERLLQVRTSRIRSCCVRVLKWGFVESFSPYAYHAFHVDFERVVHSQCFKIVSYVIMIKNPPVSKDAVISMKKPPEGEIVVKQTGDVRDGDLLEILWQTNEFDSIPELMKARDFEAW